MAFVVAIIGAIVSSVGAVVSTVGAVVSAVGGVVGLGGLGAGIAGIGASTLEFGALIGMGGTLSALGLVAAVGIAGGAIAATFAIASLLNPHSNLTAQPLGFKADISAGVPYVIGRTGVGGNIIFADTSDDSNNTYLHYFTVLSGAGPIQGIDSFTANNIPVTFNPSTGTLTAEGVNWRGGWSSSAAYAVNDAVGIGGSDYIATAASINVTPPNTSYWQTISGPSVGNWGDAMWQIYQLGEQPEDAIGTVSGTGSVPEWGSSQATSGFAIVRWILKASTGSYPTGTPQPLWVVRGPSVYDPRLDSTYPGGSGSQRSDDRTTWAYSENPYLHALTWCLGQTHNGKRVLGIGAPIANIDVAAFVAGANVADANGWNVGGQVFSTDSKWEVLTSMLQAGGGVPLQLGAMISCLVDTPKTSVATLTGNDVVGPCRVPGSQPRRDRINRVMPRYRSEGNNWQMVVAAPVEVSAYITADGEQRTKGVDFPLVQQVDQVAQLSAYGIFDARELGPIELSVKPRWQGIRPGDVFTMNEPELGLNSQTLLCLNRSLDPSTMAVTLTCRTETNAKHAAALALSGTAPPTPALTGIDLTLLAAPGGSAWSAAGASFTNGTVTVPAIVVTGVIDNPNVNQIIIEQRVTGTAIWTQVGVYPPNTTQVELTGVTAGTTYDIAVSYMVRGVVGAQLVIGAVTAGAFNPGTGSGPGNGTILLNDSVPGSGKTFTCPTGSYGHVDLVLTGIGGNGCIVVTDVGEFGVEIGPGGASGAGTAVTEGFAVTPGTTELTYTLPSAIGGNATCSATGLTTMTAHSGGNATGSTVTGGNATGGATANYAGHSGDTTKGGGAGNLTGAYVDQTVAGMGGTAPGGGGYGYTSGGGTFALATGAGASITVIARP